ncbi:MAG: ATP-binding protein [Spirochaetota bacterium]
MKRSLFIKILSGYVAVILFMFLYLLFLSSRVLRSSYIETLKKDLREFALPLLIPTEQLLRDGQYDELDALVKRIGYEADRRITVIDITGRVIADSIESPELMENHQNRPEVIRALSDGVGSSLRYSETLQEKMLYVAVPVMSGGERVGVLRVSIFLRSINKLLSELRKRFYLPSFFMLAFFSVVAFIVSQRFYLPVRQLNEAVKRAASGDMSMKVILRSRDELAQLAENYNRMTDRIKTYMDELSAKTDELNAIISSMHPGLIVLSRDGQILLHNESARTLIKDVDPGGKFYWQVLKEAVLLDLIQEVHEKRGALTREVHVDGRFLQINAGYLDSIDMILLNFNDVTDIRNLERIKRDFVVNVSHELRTPLTAIKGYAETIEQVGVEDRKYLEIIKRHTDRLIRIVEDLLTLSELEEQGFKLESEKVDLKQIVEHVIRMFDPKIKEKKLHIHLDVDEGLPVITGDSLKLEQVFINLIDNAVKYTEEGGISITLKKNAETIKAEIKDSGIGIAEKHLPRIFERFYTVDKSRSRRLGGTGLGLSIVKHIVNLHGGSVDIQSTPGMGTTVRVNLPMKNEKNVC